MWNLVRQLRWLVSLAAITLVGACQAAPQVTGASTQLAAAQSINFQVPNPVVRLSVAGRSKTSGEAVTFAQPFVRGDVASTETLEAITAGGQRLSTQVDWKAAHEDGSRRHGIITIALPDSSAKRVPIGLYSVSSRQSDGEASYVAPPQDLDAQIVLNIDGAPHSASFEQLRASRVDRTWLSGELVTEWHVSGPVTTKAGEAHDRIWVQFYVRRYAASGRTRLVVIVENTWAFKPNPRNVAYDVQVLINGREVYTRNDLTHTDHARWREEFWSGEAPQVYVQHDLGYLKSTGTIPNYDPTLEVPGSAVAKLYNRFKASGRAPMQISIVNKGMPSGGGRPDIGPLPAWTVLRLLTMDPRSIEVDNSIGVLAGSWPVHLRDETTRLPVSLEKRPRVTTHPNLAKRKSNPLPLAEYGERPNHLYPDISHQPSFAFVPYLLTGDYYYLEEMQFWAAWNPLRTSPKYRGYEKGWFKWAQIRGQAWSLRTLGQVAYIIPDDHSMKQYWIGQLQGNLDWYNEHYFGSNADRNRLGFLEGNVIYPDDKKVRRGIAPWQDDFFTWAMGYLVGLGFEDARPMLDYKARFPVGRMTASGYCWVLGSIYKLYVRETQGSSFYDKFARAYDETVSPEMAAADCGSAQMASLLGEQYRAGDMSGYPSSPQGFPANMQPALAVAVDAGIPGAKQAWTIFMNRTTKPDYSSYPNWAIVPEQ